MCKSAAVVLVETTTGIAKGPMPTPLGVELRANADEANAVTASAGETRTTSLPIKVPGTDKDGSDSNWVDELLADRRDYVFYRRILDGILRQQDAVANVKVRRENEVCVSNIIGVRNLTVEELEYYCNQEPQTERQERFHDSTSSSSEGIFQMDL